MVGRDCRSPLAMTGCHFAFLWYLSSFTERERSSFVLVDTESSMTLRKASGTIPVFVCPTGEPECCYLVPASPHLHWEGGVVFGEGEGQWVEDISQ